MVRYIVVTYNHQNNSYLWGSHLFDDPMGWSLQWLTKMLNQTKYIVLSPNQRAVFPSGRFSNCYKRGKNEVRKPRRQCYMEGEFLLRGWSMCGRPIGFRVLNQWSQGSDYLSSSDDFKRSIYTRHESMEWVAGVWPLCSVWCRGNSQDQAGIPLTRGPGCLGAWATWTVFSSISIPVAERRTKERGESTERWLECFVIQWMVEVVMEAENSAKGPYFLMEGDKQLYVV